MSVRVGINGFGRIGRSVFRILAERRDLEVVAINDLYDNAQLVYLLQYDTVMGRFERPVRADDDWLYLDDRRIAMTGARSPAEVPWRDLGVEIVVESSGVFRSRAKLQGHLDAGAERVVLTVPPDDDIDAMIVVGVNDGALRPEHRLVSNASCTTNCLAPVAKVLNEAIGIERGLMTTIHAYTNDQKILDQIHSDMRRARAAGMSMIPTTTGAARAVGEVLPELKGKLDGSAIRVPTPNVSLVDLTFTPGRDTSKDEINAALKAASESGPLKGILEYTDEPLVSSDLNGSPASSTVDSLETAVIEGKLVRVVSWYDNEWGFSNRMVDTAVAMAKLG